MSYDPSSSPYSNPPAPPAKPAGEMPMRYLYAYQYLFENPNWVTNVLLATICVFIPIVGPMVLLGYQFMIIESLLLRRSATYPDFDFGRFSDMLTRGIWPFLASLAANVVLMPLMLILYIGFFMCFGFAGAAIADSNEALGVVCMISGFVIFFLAILILSVVFGLVIIPMMLAAGLSQEFGPAFNFTFIKDFIARVWKEMVLSTLFISFTGMLLMTLGGMFFCVGMYVAVAVMILANAHILFQLYNLYLARGGVAIAMKEGK